MFEKNDLRQSLKMTRKWFENSGVMLPADGTWGVAERIVTPADSANAGNVYRYYPAWTNYGQYSVIEQRRADCNLETAWFFLLCWRIFQRKRDYDIAVNILQFLYCRSGLLNITPDQLGSWTPVGVWQWSNVMWWKPCIWFDDNAWMCFLQLEIAESYPEFDRRFQMSHWGVVLADVLAREVCENFDRGKSDWLGSLTKPHWGALVVMALSRAFRLKPNEKYRTAAGKIMTYIAEKHEEFHHSNDSYALLGACAAYCVWRDPLSEKLAHLFARKITGVVRPDGSIPTQASNNEVPHGDNLTDTIYTLNWSFLGLQSYAGIWNDDGAQGALNRIIKLLLQIQDRSPETWCHGCWRGMYDMETGKWGGGDTFEGGAGSIYTGWTNAPIGWGMANALTGKSLFARQ